MFFDSRWIRTYSQQHFSYSILFFASLFVFSAFTLSRAQGGVDFAGTGGRHTIQGRIYFPSGRRADVQIKVRLESTSAGEIAVFADGNGSFSFKSLTAGSYTIVVEGGKEYETVRESLYIDQVKSRVMRDTTQRVFTVPIYLRLKAESRSSEAKPGLVSAALAKVPKPAADLYEKALVSAQAGDSKKAIEQLQAAISIQPEFPLALNELGVQYLKLGQAEKAVETLRSCVRIEPEAFTPRLNYGIALLNKKEFAEAETQLRQALKKNDTAPTAHMYLGITLISLRNYDEAEKELLRTLTVGGNNLSLPHYYLGGIYWEKRQYKRAADELETYLKLAPKAPDAERLRATIRDLRAKS